MEILRQRMEEDTDDIDKISLYTLGPQSTVYIQNIAVKDGYRHKGIGNWLLRNLPQIIINRYYRDPAPIIIKLFPEDINWDTTPPDFRPFGIDRILAGDTEPYDPDEIEKIDEADPMFLRMKRLLEKNGYKRYRDTLYFIKDSCDN